MADVETLKRQVKDLSPDELAAFRKWFLEDDWEAWDSQLERNVAAGKLDSHAEKALRDHAGGRTKKL